MQIFLFGSECLFMGDICLDLRQEAGVSKLFVVAKEGMCLLARIPAIESPDSSYVPALEVQAMNPGQENLRLAEEGDLAGVQDAILRADPKEPGAYEFIRRIGYATIASSGHPKGLSISAVYRIKVLPLSET